MRRSPARRRAGVSIAVTLHNSSITASSVQASSKYAVAERPAVPAQRFWTSIVNMAFAPFAAKASLNVQT